VNNPGVDVMVVPAHKPPRMSSRIRCFIANITKARISARLAFTAGIFFMTVRAKPARRFWGEKAITITAIDH
jgi:hypothetical protein